MPVRILITEGTRANCKEAVRLIEGISAQALLADRGYDTNDILAYAVSAGMKPVIPPKKNRKEQRDYDKIPAWCKNLYKQNSKKTRMALRKQCKRWARALPDHGGERGGMRAAGGVNAASGRRDILRSCTNR